jgi:hypothetical protein
MEFCHLQMDKTGDHHVKRNKPEEEQLRPRVLSHMQNLDINEKKVT